MSVAQTITIPSVLRQAPLYPFLSHPPPQKKRPTKPLPSPPVQQCPSPIRSPNSARRRAATTSAIVAWAANVNPGSPAPYSPRRSPSASIMRRPSAGSAGLPSASFMNFLDTPTTASKITPSIQDFKPDLTAMGYTSIFVNLPKTPSSPTDGRRKPSSPKATPHSPAKTAQRGLKRFQSLSALRSTRRTRSKAPPSPITTARTPQESARARPQLPAAAKSKKSKYPKMRPAPLCNELALAQLIDGGTMEEHARHYSRSHAKAAGAVRENGQLVGVGDVWRDGRGNVWMDCDEAWEYAHLLGKDSPQSDWVRFEDGEKELDGERPKSLSTQDSDLSPRYAMHTEFDSRDDLAAFTSASERELRKPGMSVLAIPSRSRRTAKHLRKPEFLLNVFPVPLSPKATGSLKSMTSPRIAAFHAAAMKSKVRRRPAPLKLVPFTPASKFPTNPADLDQCKRDFLEDSFAPTLVTESASQLQMTHRHLGPSACQVQTESYKMTSRSSVLNMRSVFKAMSSKKDVAA